MTDILDGNRNALVGIDILRKICNHPDLLQRASNAGMEDYGNPVRSGKLQVAVKVLKHWHEQGHKYVFWVCVCGWGVGGFGGG